MFSSAVLEAGADLPGKFHRHRPDQVDNFEDKQIRPGRLLRIKPLANVAPAIS